MIVTMRDVAKKIGVCQQTVSEVLNEKWREKRVSYKTREKVLKAIEEMNYYPHAIARALASKKTDTIGIAVSDISNPFFGELLKVLEEETFRSGYDTVLSICERTPERERGCLKLIGQNKIDGLIAWSGSETFVQLYSERFNKSTVPLVILGYQVDDKVNYVAVDRSGGMSTAVDHLVQLGHHHIGYAGVIRPNYPEDCKYGGFRKGLINNGIEHNVRFDFGCTLSRKDGYILAKKVADLSERPSAIVAESDLVALGLMRGLREKGLDIPGDIALVGYDGIEASEFAEVPLTTIKQPKQKIAQEAIRILMGNIKEKQTEPTHILLEPELVVRQSTA